MDGARPLVERNGRSDLELVIEEIVQGKITSVRPAGEVDLKKICPTTRAGKPPDSRFQGPRHGQTSIVSSERCRKSGRAAQLRSGSDARATARPRRRDRRHRRVQDGDAGEPAGAGGSSVTVAMTEAATRFVTPLTFQALSGKPVYTSAWEHIEIKRPAAHRARHGGRRCYCRALHDGLHGQARERPHR